MNWISAEDKLPDDSTTVIVATPDDPDPVWLGYYEGGRWYSAEGCEVYVTHWCEMPAPPEEQ